MFPYRKLSVMNAVTTYDPGGALVTKDSMSSDSFSFSRWTTLSDCA